MPLPTGVPEKLWLVLQVSHGTPEQGMNPPAVRSRWSVVELRVSGQVMEVPLDRTHEQSVLIIQGVHRMLETATQERLTGVHQVEANARIVIVLKQPLHKSHLGLAVSGTERNHIQSNGPRQLAKLLGCRCQRRCFAPGSDVTCVAECDPVERTFVIQIDVCLFNLSTAAFLSC